MRFALFWLIPFLAIFHPAHAAAYVPPFLEWRSVSVEAGKVYRFPWLSEPVSCNGASPGCFRVLSLSDAGARIRFVGFVVVRGRAQGSGFIRELIVSPEATAGELFSIKSGSAPRETWVHAYYRPRAGQMVFFSRPAFVTRRAKLDRKIVMDLRAKTMEETTRVEAAEPLTLIASGPVEKALPGAERRAIVVNGQRPFFPFRNLLDLNLPPGVNWIRTSFRWRRLPEEVCPWSLYEGKKMSLPTRTDLHLVGLNKNRRYELRLSMFGIPEDIWQRFQPILATSPRPSRRVRIGLSEYLDFANTETVAISFKPIYFHRAEKGGATFPVLVCFREVRADGN